jgi:signal recognition particle receptor subunit beta
MVQIDFQRREVAIKLVYYGPALSGKTTNLQQLHQRIDPSTRGRLLALDTKDDRTLFFDLLPIVFKSQSGLTIKVKLFTVPGQVIHNSTRRLVLQGADGVAFIADSRVAEVQHNNESYANLKANLKENGFDPAETPIVIQFNKRDLPGIRSDGDLAKIAARGKEPIYRASAIHGKGIVETFFGLVRLTWDRLDARYQLSGKFTISREDFLRSLATQLHATSEELAANSVGASAATAGSGGGSAQ